MITKQRKRKKSLTMQINVRLEPETLREVEQIAVEERRKVGEIGRFAIEEFIARRKAHSGTNGAAA